MTLTQFAVIPSVGSSSVADRAGGAAGPNQPIEHRRRVLAKDEALRDQLVESVLHLRGIDGHRGIALLDRQPGIARGKTLGLRLRERNPLTNALAAGAYTAAQATRGQAAYGAACAS